MAHRALVVGAGPRARQWIRAIGETDGWGLAGVVDIDEAVLASALSELSLPGSDGYPSLEAALEGTEANVAVIACPAEMHCDMANAAMSNGRHVLIEKPLAPTMAEAEQVVRAAEENGVVAVVGQNYRYMRAHRTARELVRSGKLGHVNLVNASYWRVPHEMTSSLAGSGQAVLWGMAVHHLDALRHVLGQDAIEVTADITTCRPDTSPEGSTLRALITFNGGTRLTYSATYESSGHEYFEGGQEYYQRFTGDKGTLHMLHRWLVLCPKGGLPRVVRRGRRDRSEESLLLLEMSDAIAGKPVSCTARENLGTMAILEACVRSSSERRTVSLSEPSVRS